MYNIDFRNEYSFSIICFPTKGGEGLKGKIQKLIWERGFGFISAEVFFHRSSLRGINFNALEEGNSVEFDLERGPKGFEAVNIRVIKKF